jgi:type IV pilus assembly protein PilA
MKKILRGFTLIELLVVIGILAILLAITLIAINPARQFAQANNTRERSDILQILNAVHQYVAENKGVLPTSVSALTVDTPTVIGGGAGQADLCPEIMGATGKYLPALPVLPSLNQPNVTVCNATYNLGYTISRDANNRITVAGDNDVNGNPITVTR